MSRRLKKKIRELVGLEGLSKEERLLRAKEVLENQHTKQKLCNLVPGLTFKDIDRAMKDVISERQPTEKEQEELELREIAPEKFEPPVPALLRPPHLQGKQNRELRYESPTREQVAWLLEQSKKPIKSEEPIKKSNTNYRTYTREEVAALLNGTYNPENFKKK